MEDCGVLSAEVPVRARTPGAMMSVGLSKGKVLAFLVEVGTEKNTSSVAVGCINSPDNVTLTGVEQQIDILKITMERHQIFVRKLKTGIAYHSTYMDEIALNYERSLGKITSGCSLPKSPTVSMFSTVSGKMVSPRSLRESEYWVRNVKSPLQFLDAMSSILCQVSKEHRNGPDGAQNEVGTINHLLEISPHSTL